MSSGGYPRGVDWRNQRSQMRTRNRPLQHECGSRSGRGRRLYHGESGYPMANRVPPPCGAAVSHSSVRKPWRSQAPHTA
jgi:hypothetical protein